MNSNAQMLGFALISAAVANAQPSQLRGLPSESNPDPAWDCGSVLAGEFRIGLRSSKASEEALSATGSASITRVLPAEQGGFVRFRNAAL
jgi:hypothetical protein